MDDFSRLLFSFSQFFFIFKHSNLIIRAHESLARLAVMHIVVTNLCVWYVIFMKLYVLLNIFHFQGFEWLSLKQNLK